MRVGVTGSTGLIGSALTRSLTAGNHQVHRLVRPGGEPGPGDVSWNPRTGELDAPALDGVDWVVHLAGENIAGGRWSAERRTAIVTSRVQGTHHLANGLAALTHTPHTLIAASAIGYYGDRGDETLTERSGPGDTFLATVAKSWEEATRPAAEAGIRVVNLRIGIVLSAAGGALAKMLPVFRLGLGGPLGAGRQWMSWIGLDDLVRAIQFTATTAELTGPVNAVAPAPATNRHFTRILGKALGRPAVLPVPAFAIELALGDMGTELLLHSARVTPAKLLAAGFEFQHADLGAALEHAIRAS